ncbi:MAG: hypothetical protein ACTHOB_03005 [Ginsengibacter sp.]
MVEYPEISIQKPKVRQLNREVQSIGLLIPFQPCMQDKRTISKVFNYAIELIQTKLEENSVLLAESMSIAQLEKIFRSLNYHSHCKSVAVILTPDTEKVIYLNYFADSTVVFNQHFSLLDLAGNMETNPEFQLLFLEKTEIIAYHFLRGKLNKVYSNKNKSQREVFPGISEISSVVNILKAVDKANDIPVFIAGEEHLIERFYNNAPAREIIFNISSFTGFLHKNTQPMILKINEQWKYWRARLIRGQVELAKRSNTFIAGREKVLTALQHLTDGILFIDKSLKEQVDNSILIKSPGIFCKELPDLLEEFLMRGNRVEITQPGLLEEHGGIVLIKKLPYNVFKSSKPTQKEFRGCIF